MKDVRLQVLRAKIRGFQASGETLHRWIHKAEGQKRNQLWNEKRLLGFHSRHHLIAYALIRGIPYEKVEHCAEENRPKLQLIHQLVLAHVPTWEHKKWTEEAVKALLEPTEKRLEK